MPRTLVYVASRVTVAIHLATFGWHREPFLNSDKMLVSRSHTLQGDLPSAVGPAGERFVDDEVR